MVERHTNEVSDLLEWVDAQPPVLGQDWLRGLDERKQEEAHFHDADRAGHRDDDRASSPNRRFYEAAAIVDRYVERRIQELAPGANVLDYACGSGRLAIKAAQAGARAVIGIDISEVSARNAAENAAAAGVARSTRFLQRDCENTELPGGQFDLIICTGMLHHLDLSVAFPELHRLAAPGGRVLCVEALAYNPVIQWYRDRTPELRTEWERRHILSLREVRFARRWFQPQNIRYFLMTAPLATYLPGGIRRFGLRIGHAIDAVATRVPLLKLWSWIFAFELVRPASD